MQILVSALFVFSFAVSLGQCDEFKKFKMDSKSKEAILRDKKFDVFLHKDIEFYMKNPYAAKQRQCFAKLDVSRSINFVLDLASSPSLDEVDKRCANSPTGLFLQYLYSYSPRHFSPSKAYFDAIQDFIDAVTFDVKPQCSHVILYNKEDGRSFYLRGRDLETVDLKSEAGYSGDFNDLERNLKTMWPVATKSKPDDANLRRILKNNLGRMTKLALWNRDNGLPTVLFGSELSKPVYTIVITDGSSGAKITDLTSDLGATTVIDIGENRFADRLTWDEMKQLVSLVSLPAPQSLPMMINSVRTMLCWLIENRSS
jgi:hypothetical protein